jgi:hypothetical protein
MNRIEIVSSRSANTVSIDLGTFTVTQIVRFPSGNFFKQSYPCESLPEARGWARALAAEGY